MSSHDAHPVRPVRAWSNPGDSRRRSIESGFPASYRYLLDVDEELADEFDLRMRIVVRRAVSVLVFEAPVGPCDAAQWFDRSPGPGLLILDGLIAVDVGVSDRTATELVGSGDLLQPWDNAHDDLIERAPSWRALVPTQIAVLDEAFAERARPWPQIIQALLRRAGRRAHELGVQRAINGQPRLEVRLVLLFWHLAGRWGRVEPGGIHLSLPLTHALLGRLAGAERPSVSHALGRLSAAGLVTGSAGDWHLHGTADEQRSRLQRAAERHPRRLRPRRSTSRSAVP